MADWVSATKTLDKGTDSQTCFISWNPLPHDWIKLNVDSSMRPELGSIAAGGVFRDDIYNWLSGFAMNKGVGSALEAEMWGIFEGMSIAWKTGYKKLVIETDSMSAVHLLNATLPQNHHLFSIAQACRNLMEEDWSCTICHGYRESNRVADSLANLANLGHSLDLGTIVFERPPPQISILLDEDLRGLSFARIVPRT
ncbi:hypothetical protein Dsin_015035 [Dipteronia sinensis]|uniref:RNase H type-1 domain-containing protein n=1 Tax=Dipteronia sinensis TaxID=43782 RepID=A0AAE0EC55_9ROSI|nr:hypothetical protein Dsin_015035 [Dipteronia sinensis]